MSDLEGALECLELCALPRHAQRLGVLLRSGKEASRAKAVGKLAHFSAWRDECVEHVPSSLQSPAALERYVLSAGAEPTCYVLSEDPAVDGQRMMLGAALERLVGSEMGSFLVLAPSRMALHIGEGPGSVTLLKAR